ncbi:hypothetical protein GLY44_11995 [Salmonella enterica]|nr:hypothetical protein [Salmonella enterica]ELC3721773.1 hypothetical protein [Salmonella enterica]
MSDTWIIEGGDAQVSREVGFLAILKKKSLLRHLFALDGAWKNPGQMAGM